MDEEDRNIAREVIAEARLKKFPLLGKGEQTSREKVSLPPGATLPRKSTSSSVDDELPERMSKDHSRASTSSNPEKEDEESTEEKAKVKIPARAGFDLAALSAAAAEVKKNLAVEELQAAAHIPVSKHPLPERMESAPQLSLRPSDKNLPPSPSTPTAPTPYRTTYFSQSNPGLSTTNDNDDSDLPKRFNEISFQDDRSRTPVSHSFNKSTSPTSISSIKSPYGDYAYSTPDPFGTAPSTSSSQYADTPTLSFGGADGSVWTPTPSTSSTFNSISTLNDTYSFSKPFTAEINSNKASVDKGLGASTGPSLYSSNPFGSSSPNPFASSTLSFGDKEGSISLGSTGSQRDPWAPKPIVGSKKPAYTVNPWES